MGKGKREAGKIGNRSKESLEVQIGVMGKGEKEQERGNRSGECP